MRNVYLSRELELDSSPEHNALRHDILKEVVIYNIANFWHSGSRSAYVEMLHGISCCNTYHNGCVLLWVVLSGCSENFRETQYLADG